MARHAFIDTTWPDGAEVTKSIVRGAVKLHSLKCRSAAASRWFLDTYAAAHQALGLMEKFTAR